MLDHIYPKYSDRGLNKKLDPDQTAYEESLIRVAQPTLLPFVQYLSDALWGDQMGFTF